jgi:hypothetical protein
MVELIPLPLIELQQLQMVELIPLPLIELQQLQMVELIPLPLIELQQLQMVEQIQLPHSVEQQLQIPPFNGNLPPLNGYTPNVLLNLGRILEMDSVTLISTLKVALGTVVTAVALRV